MGPLMAVGYKKTLDLEDVPQLASVDSVEDAFTILRDKLEYDSGSSSRVTTFGLVKALIFTTWKESLLTAFLALVYTLASYVGPFLMDSFVQYLNGRREFDNEGYLLVLAFSVAKLVECLSQRHWFFRLQQVGIRARAALVALIYNKGLTLSFQSKQGHTSGEIINFMSVDAERIGDFSWHMHDPWLVVVQVALALVILYKNIGLASIAAFVATPDVIEKLPRGSSDIAIEIVDGRFSWDISSPNPTLKDINIKVSHGMRVAVCGSVGSGKSSFLSCIMGEMPKLSGNVKLSGTKAYVSQSPWIQSGKIVDNILFGKEMDKERYEKVLEACSLKDLEILSFGDQTVIGERGINLSGGQKQRIQIARALYQDADIHLFDDPFSAVDAHTGSHLFKECLLGLLDSKTVIYVTHQVEFLPAADLILVMKDGRITQAGKYDDILKSGSDFMELVGAHKEALSALDSIDSGILEDKGVLSATNVAQKEKTKNDEHGKEDDTIGPCPGGRKRKRAPMSFFDATPSGRILNRASTDQSAVDLDIPFQVGAFAFSSIQLLGIIGVMSQVAWQVFLVFVPVIGICIWLQQYYIPSAQELARLFGVCKAPVIQHFAGTISGLTTIRSFDQASRFRATSMKFIDAYSRPKFNSVSAMEWLRFCLEVLSSFTFAFSLVFLISIPEGTIDPSIAGLAVTYGLNLNMLQALVIWDLYSMEKKIISVERILQYTAIPSEPPLVTELNRLDHHWPSHGEVNVCSLQVICTVFHTGLSQFKRDLVQFMAFCHLSYMPFVFNVVGDGYGTCTFGGGTKTGIVGRTGSGKSTLIQTLFHIVEPTTGHIVIDGINISSNGLHDLRSRLSIIPQDPTMFEGTVQSNLDPLEEYTDERIWEVLDKCQLGDEVRKNEGKLDSTVAENGENWSMGQRQLVCLGRVLLKKSRVLVLDEATASVDTATDNMIQQTLRQHFTDSTVITIAHRITSVLDSDMVLLLDRLVEEYDSPSKLLENKSLSFASLLAEYSARSNSSFGNLANIQMS
ncbi:hypothetical protein RJ639_038139 [Escallonia herrerae]|uniref:ABC-type xenobiotic transporter n=1 Tax=Escallonia herrerae TaxID=1293975 RepID=A0AA88WRI1_9ASTE|nr:hypothetical protein RJ639_038139 [Escallonia herrerae]